MLNVKVVVNELERVFGHTVRVVPGQLKGKHDETQLVVLDNI